MVRAFVKVKISATLIFDSIIKKILYYYFGNSLFLPLSITISQLSLINMWL